MLRILREISGNLQILHKKNVLLMNLALETIWVSD